MRIQDIILQNTTVHIDKPVDLLRELKPVCNVNDVDENSIFFYPKPLSAKEYVLPDFKTNPYLAVCDYRELKGEYNFPIARVKNARRALSFAYSTHNGIDYKRLKIIGITGTNGKTSTATILERILTESGKSTGFIGTGRVRINGKQITNDEYSMTTPDPSMLYAVLSEMANAGVEYVVMEVSSHALSLYKCAPIDFTLGIFTNLSSEHMDFYQNKEEYFRTKLTLFERCDKSVFNVDDEYGEKAYNEAKGEKYSVGVINCADATVTALKLGASRSEFFYKEQSLIFQVNLKLCGAYNVYNALLAAKAAIVLGIPPCIVKKALCSIDRIEGRFEVIHTSPKIIIDYAHTEEALSNLLKFLHSTKNIGQNIIVVFGCGGNRDKTKRIPMGRTADKYAQKIIITEDNSRDENFYDIAENILIGIKEKDKVTVIEDRREAIKTAVRQACKNDIIALIGKGHERYIIDKNGKHPFDEREIVRQALEERNENEN